MIPPKLLCWSPGPGVAICGNLGLINQEHPRQHSPDPYHSIHPQPANSFLPRNLYGNCTNQSRTLILASLPRSSSWWCWSGDIWPCEIGPAAQNFIRIRSLAVTRQKKIGTDEGSINLASAADQIHISAIFIVVNIDNTVVIMIN